MICQICNQKNATVHYTEVVNGQKQEFQICESCALSSGYLNSFKLENFLTTLLNNNHRPTTLMCRNCNTTYEEFREKGKLCCSECYSEFKEQLVPIFRKIHGNNIHTGKIPKRIGSGIKLKREIDMLKFKLNQAVEKQEFEEAARLRDMIKEKENQ